MRGMAGQSATTATPQATATAHRPATMNGRIFERPEGAGAFPDVLRDSMPASVPRAACAAPSAPKRSPSRCSPMNAPFPT